MSDRIRDARDRWRTEHHLYDAYGSLLKDRIRESLVTEGIQAEIEGRPKGEVNLVKKLMLKQEHTYDSLGDKYGVRIIVSNRDEAQRVLALVHEHFECHDDEDTAQRLAPNTLGYRGWHLFVLLKETDPQWTNFRAVRAELQIHTQAQYLWAKMSHPIYKSGTDVPKDLIRRMYLLAGLLELADDEFLRLEREIAGSPGMGAVLILEALERLYIKMEGVLEWDRELSLEVVQHLVPLYEPAQSRDIVKSLDNLYASETAHLHMIIAREQKSDVERSAFILQPEVLMIYGLLKKDRYALRRRWAIRFPEEELERFALAFGMPL